MAHNETIHRYLSELETHLSRVSKARAEEVVQEIESHIYDALALQPDDPVEAILGRLGTPRELAAGYIDHITIGVAPPKGLRPLARVGKGISKGLYYLACSLGYGTGAALLAAAAAKLVVPRALGVWVAEHGNSIVLSFDPSDRQASELSAALLVPVALLAGAGIIYLTARVARILKLHV